MALRQAWGWQDGSLLDARHCTGHLVFAISMTFLSGSERWNIIPVLQMKKLKLREVRFMSSYHKSHDVTFLLKNLVVSGCSYNKVQPPYLGLQTLYNTA